jgi:hypothetical protein
VDFHASSETIQVFFPHYALAIRSSSRFAAFVPPPAALQRRRTSPWPLLLQALETQMAFYTTV